MKLSLKIKILVVFCLLFPRLISAQKSNDLEIIKREITNLFKKADKLKLQNVLPFKVNNKTGFVDAHSNKIILKPTADLTDVTLFNPSMKGVYKEQYIFEILSNKFEVKINEIEQQDFEFSRQAPEQPKVEVISSKNGYKGFTVDEKGNLISYSDMYFVEETHLFNVMPFLFKGKYYAIAIKKTGADEYFDGVIDTAGNPLPHFNFEQKCISKIKEEDDDIWFSVGTCRGLKGTFISFNGKNKLKDELVGSVRNDVNIFKYNLNVSGDWKIKGILDIDELEWVLKPQAKINILKLDYTSEKELNVEKLEERKNAKLYFLVKDENKEYYIDFKMKKYFPYK